MNTPTDSQSYCVQQCTHNNAFLDAIKLPVSCTDFTKFYSSVSPPTSLLHPLEHTKMPLSFVIALRGLNTICEK